MAISIDVKQLNYDQLLTKFNELTNKVDTLSKEIKAKSDKEKLLEEEIKAKDALLELAAIREDNLNNELNEIKEKFKFVRTYIYGKKSEKNKIVRELLKQNDSLFADEDLKPDNKNDLKIVTYKDKTIKVTKKSYEQIYSSLPKKTVIIDVEDKKCPNCGSDLEPIGTSTKTHLDFKPATFFIVEEVRPVYKCANKECESIISSEPDNSVLASCLLTGNTIAHLMTENIIKDVPLYRQEQYLKSMGINLSRMTMSNTFDKACFILEPLYNSIWDYAKQESLLHIDETPFNVLHTKANNQEKKGYIWIYANKYKSNNPFVYYAFSPDRGAYNVENRLKDSSMTIMTDGYNGYNHVGANITRACCMAHARRKFHDVLKLNSTHEKSLQFITYFNKLYEIEDKIKEFDTAEILKIRQKESKPVFESILDLLNNELKITIPKSKYYEALNYLDKFKNELQIYLNDGNIPIDNNQAERMAKYFVMYRKNSLFANTEDGANKTAMLHTIIQSARLNGLSSEKYLSLIFKELEQTPITEISKYYPWSEYVKEKCLISNEKMDN